jgi:hypothetical protein
MDLFGKGEGGNELHLKAMPKFELTPKRQREFLGRLVFQLILHGICVIRLIIKATMVFACGKIHVPPTNISINMQAIDFEAYKSSIAASIKPLLVEEEEAQINALCSIQVQDCPKIALAISHVPIPRQGFL